MLMFVRVGTKGTVQSIQGLRCMLTHRSTNSGLVTTCREGFLLLWDRGQLRGLTPHLVSLPELVSTEALTYTELPTRDLTSG